MSDDLSLPGNVPGTAPFEWPKIGLKPHRFASIFRMLSGHEKQSFEEDVLDNGLKEKIKVFEEAILDGRNRYLALIEAGVFDPELEDWRDRPQLFEAYEGSEPDALDYVWSLNEQRRHDNATQRAAAAARYANLRNVTQAEAAERFGVSERQLSSAAKVIEHGVPELEQAMDDGRLPAYLAEQMAGLDEDDQREVAAEPKGSASAMAREKLQDLPPLAESGPVVKALDASHFVMFADAVMKVCAMGHPLSAATVDALAREHALLADADGTFNLHREAVLAVEFARKRMKLADGAYAGLASVVIVAAGLPEDLDGLAQAYRNAIVLYDRAIQAGDKVGEAKFGVAMEAILFKANGNSQFGMATNERPREVIAATRAPDGTVPMWGQQGCFVAEGEWRGQKVRAIVVLGQYNGIYAIDPGHPFPSDTGYTTVGWKFSDRNVQIYGAALISAAMRGYINHGRAMPIPATVYKIADGGTSGPVAISLEGGELDRTAYQLALANLTEPKGNLHQSSAADALRAGVEAKVSRSQMAEDLGHPIGTIQGWTAKLKLTGLGEGRAAPRPRDGA